jgi:hypothetical protein
VDSGGTSIIVGQSKCIGSLRLNFRDCREGGCSGGAAVIMGQSKYNGSVMVNWG